MATKTPKVGRPTLPKSQRQTAYIRKRCLPSVLKKFDKIGGGDWLVPAIEREYEKQFGKDTK